jgi:hypothetical protein
MRITIDAPPTPIGEPGQRAVIVDVEATPTGLGGARDEFHLAAIVQNLKTPSLAITAKHRSRLLCLSVSGIEHQL